MSDEPSRKKRSEDPSYVTIPPELRDFVPPNGAQNELLAQLAKNPRLVASAAALRQLNGGQDADPLFFDTRGVATALERSDEGDEAKGAGNAKVHVPAFALLSATTVAKVTGAEVNAAAEDAEITVERVRASVKAPASEKAASPWATEIAVAPIAASELPSALAPVARTEPAPASEKAAKLPPPHEGRLVRAGIALVVLVVLGFAAFQLVPKEKTKDPVAAVPVVSSAAAVPPLVVSATAPSVPPAVGTVEIDAGAPVPSGSAATVVPVKAKNSGDPVENIYDAAAPSPAKTVEPVVPPPPTTAPVAAPAKTVEPVPQSSASSGFYLRKKPQ